MMTDDGVEHTFDKLEQLRRLVKVDYSENMITDKGAESLAVALGHNRKTQIESILFNNNQLTKKGLKAILSKIK